MTQAAKKIIGRVRRGVQSVAYGNPLYQKILAAGETPVQLHFTPIDPWPGDANAGMALLTEQVSMFDMAEDSSVRNAAPTLRNLRAVGTDAAREMCVCLIDRWLQQFDGWDEEEWSPENLGARIAAWIGFYDFYAPVAPSAFTQTLVTSLHRQWKHLERTISTSLKGIEAVQAARGLIYGGLNFQGGDGALGLACDLLQRQLTAEILPDGGHISRNPSAQLHILRHLVDIRNVLEMAGIQMPPSIGAGLSALIPGVKFFRHGDGGLALFHGAIEESPLMIDSVLTQAVVRGRVVRRMPESGYERLIAGRSLLMIDAGSPPPVSYGKDGHAGLMSFEFSVGRERIIVNCGAVPNGEPAWRAACAATAAHSTLTVGDTNACDIDDDGGIAGQVMTSSQRFEEDGAQSIEMAHNGYYPRFGLTHTRTLKLSGDGDTLIGRDILQGRKGRDFTVRWHIHPSVHVSLSQGGQTALLRTASGSGWRLRVERGELGLESSIYCGNATPRRTMQIRTSGITVDGDTTVAWNLARERKI
ncbi:MAG: heparinase II/III family protein [Bdellovibrionales bacterium]